MRARRHARLRLAHALVLAVLEHAQQLRLQLAGQLADLVQEERALAGVLEVARLRRLRPGEGALGVAEERGLDQRGRDGRAVEREERLAPRAGSGGAARYATRSLPLPDSPSISAGKRRGGVQVDLAPQPAQRGALADQGAHVLGVVAARRARRSEATGRGSRAGTSGSQGFGTSSTAPSARARRAFDSSFWPVSTRMRVCGAWARRSPISLKPSLGRCATGGRPRSISARSGRRPARSCADGRGAIRWRE